MTSNKPILKAAYRINHQRATTIPRPQCYPAYRDNPPQVTPIAVPEDYSDTEPCSEVKQSTTINEIFSISRRSSSRRTTSSISPSLCITLNNNQNRNSGRRSTFPRMLQPTSVDSAVSLQFEQMKMFNINLLNDRSLEFWLKKSAIASELFNNVCLSLNIRERKYFGLYYFKEAINFTKPAVGSLDDVLDSVHNSTGRSHSRSHTNIMNKRRTARFSWQGGLSGEDSHNALFHSGIPFWVKMNKKLSEQCKRTTHFWFGVRIYPPDPCRDLHDELSRSLFCIQLRQDLISGRLACSFFTYVVLSAYWVQSELGDWDLYHVEGNGKCRNEDCDVSYLNGLPLAFGKTTSGDDLQWPRSMSEQAWIRSTTGSPYPPPLIKSSASFLQYVAHFHKQLRGIVPSRADYLFLQTAQKLSTYGIELHRVQDAVYCTRTGLPSTSDKLTRNSKYSQSLRRTNLNNLGGIRIGRRRSLPIPPLTFHSLSAAFHSTSPPSSSSRQNDIEIGSKSAAYCDDKSFPLFLGIFHGGIYVVWGRLRLELMPWSAIVKMAYRRDAFQVYLRQGEAENSDVFRMVKYGCGTTALAKRLYRSCVEHHAFFRLQGPVQTPVEPFPFPTGTRLVRLHVEGRRSFVESPSASSHVLEEDETLALSSAASRSNEQFLQRSHPTATLGIPQPPISPRPISEPDIRDKSRPPPNISRHTSFVRSAHKLFQRLFCKSTSNRRRRFTAPSMSSTIKELRHKPSSETPALVHQSSSTLLNSSLGEELSLPNLLSEPAHDVSFVSESSAAMTTTARRSLPFFFPEWNRPPLPGPMWRLSLHDTSPGLLVDPGTGLSLSRDWRQFEHNSTDSLWRGARATWGVSGIEHPLLTNPASRSRRRFFYEVKLNGHGPVRIGWSTMNANLNVGEDSLGVAYLSQVLVGQQTMNDENKPPPQMDSDRKKDDVWQKADGFITTPTGDIKQGALMIGGVYKSFVESSNQDDVIGCHLDLDTRVAYWTRNGFLLSGGDSSSLLSIASFPKNAVFYPACSLQNSSMIFNFGDTPFAFGPSQIDQGFGDTSYSSPCLPLSLAHLISEIVVNGSTTASSSTASEFTPTLNTRLTPNPRKGWCLESGDQSTGMLMSADRLSVRALLHTGWQNIQVNQTVDFSKIINPESTRDTQRVCAYFEITLLEALLVPDAGVYFGFTSDDFLDAASTITSPHTFGIGFEYSSLATLGTGGTFFSQGGIKRPYGRALRQGDVLSCIMNIENGLLFWACNGEYFGHTLQILIGQSEASSTSTLPTDDVIVLPYGTPSIFRPIILLRNSSVEVNFGDGPMPLRFIHNQRNWVPVSAFECISTKSGGFDGHLLLTLHGPNRHHSLLESDYRRRVAPKLAVFDRLFSSVKKSASSLSAPASSSANALEAQQRRIKLETSLATILTKIPIVAVRTHRWKSQPITSPTIPAPWSPNHLRIVRTHRVNFGTTVLPVGDNNLLLGVMETDIDGNLRLHRSTSDAARNIRLFGGTPSPGSSFNDVRRSSTTSLVEKRLALIPLVHTRIMRSRGTENVPVSEQLPDPQQSGTKHCQLNSADIPGETQSNTEYAEEMVAQEHQMADISHPSSTSNNNNNAFIASPLFNDF